MVSFFQSCLMFISLSMGFGFVYKNDLFKISTIYTEENRLLFSQNIDVKLPCFSNCLKVQSCSMVTVMEYGKNSCKCQIHEIVNFNNLSSLTEPNKNIWYKREVFMAMLDEMNPPETTEGPNDVTTQNPCPNGFTPLTAGCFKTSPDEHDKDAAVAFCTGGSQLATFENIGVCIYIKHFLQFFFYFVKLSIGNVFL